MTAGDRPTDPSISGSSIPNGLFYWIAGACGFATGILGAAFHIAVDTLSNWPVWLAALPWSAWLSALPGPAWLTQFDTRILTVLVAAAVAAVGILLAYGLTRWIAPEAAGSGVPEVEGALEGLRTVRWRRVLPVKFVGGVLALSSGLVGGREGPTIHMGASIGDFLAERLKLSRMDLHALLAAGAAAGLSAAFNAPLAAVLFVIEETRKQFRYTFRSYVAVIAASAASAFGMELVGGTAPPLFLHTQPMPLLLLPTFMVLGAVLGVLGVVFNLCLVAALDWRAAAFRRAPFVFTVIVGAAVGALSIVLPLAVRGGETLIPTLCEGDLPILTLMLIAVVRFIGTMASYPVGVPSGIFSPLLTYATTLGLIMGALIELALKAAALPIPATIGPAYAVAAMGGLFSGTIRAPLVGVVLVVELTGAYELILPVIVTCVTAHVVAQALRGRPIYEVLLERTLTVAGQLPLVRPADVSSPVGIDEPIHHRDKA